MSVAEHSRSRPAWVAAHVETPGRSRPGVGVPWHDQRVSDTEIPADLIAAKVAFYTTERELAELSDADPADPGLWKATHDKLGDLAVAIHRHPALQSLSPVDRARLDAAASKAAREQLGVL